jgi:hypothetical protein
LNLARTVLPSLCLWGWVKKEVYKRKVDKRDEFLARILNAAARVKDWEDELRRKTRDLSTLVEKFTESDGAIFEHLLRTATKLSYLCNKSVIQTIN